MRKSLLLLAVLLINWTNPPIAAAQSNVEPVVRAVLFYSPTCPHCHQVIKEVLMPMMDEYGKQLQILGVDTTKPDGGQLYQKAVERYQIPSQRRGVPTLIIGEVVLVGSGEIPEQFPTLVENYLAAGGINWPDIPELIQAVPPESQQKPTPTDTPKSTATLLPTAPSGFASSQSMQTQNKDSLSSVEFQTSPSDLLGTALAGIVLVGMVAALGYTIWRVALTQSHLFQFDPDPIASIKTWTIPLLSLVGLGVAIYLAYVEITHVEAVCGPVGECNTVQSSPYAQIMGIPVAGLGMLNYLAIVALWIGQKYTAGRLANLSVLALLGFTLAGTIFSIYLTWLEIFVIHAVCAWCLSSAVITTILMLLVAVPLTNNSSRLRISASA
jgi:uncharacterized membrane protein/glutaredoxin